MSVEVLTMGGTFDWSAFLNILFFSYSLCIFNSFGFKVSHCHYSGVKYFSERHGGSGRTALSRDSCYISQDGRITVICDYWIWFFFFFFNILNSLLQCMYSICVKDYIV